jgi:hypothetical protein
LGSHITLLGAMQPPLPRIPCGRPSPQRPP